MLNEIVSFRKSDDLKYWNQVVKRLKFYYVESSKGSFGIAYSGGFVESSDSGSSDKSSGSSASSSVGSSSSSGGSSGGYYIDTWTDSEGKTHTVIKDSSGNIVSVTNPNDAQKVLQKFQSGEIKPGAEVITKDESSNKWYGAKIEGSDYKGITQNDIIYIDKQLGTNFVDLSHTKVESGGKTITAADFARQYEPVTIGNKTIILSQDNYSKYQQTLAQHPDAKVSVENGKIKVIYPEKTEQPVNLNAFFDVSGAKTVSPQKNTTYVAPKAEISNLPGFEAIGLAPDKVGKDQTVYDVLTKTVDINIPNLETIKKVESIDTVNPAKEYHYIGIDDFEWKKNIEQKQKEDEKLLNEYLQSPARAKLTEYENKAVDVLGNAGHAIGGDIGEVFGKAVGYTGVGLSEITLGTGVSIGTALAEGSVKPIIGQGELLLEGGKDTLISAAKTIGYPILKATEGITGIPTPTPTKDDIAATLSLALPEVVIKGIKSAKTKLRTIDTDITIDTPLDLDTKLPKNEILEIGVSDGGKPYVIKTNERGRVLKRWFDIENVEVEPIEDILVEKHPVVDYTESLTVADKNKIYHREFTQQGKYIEELSYTANGRKKTVTKEIDLSKTVPSVEVTLTSETPLKKQEMKIIKNRKEMAQILSYEDALLGEKRIKSRYISDEIIRLDDLSKEDNLLPPAPDIIESPAKKPDVSIDITPKNEIKPPVEIFDVDIFDINKDVSKSRRGRVFTVDDILKKSKEEGGVRQKGGKGLLQIEKTEEKTKTKTIEKTKQKENVLDLTDAELEDVKTKTVEKVKENVLDLTKIGEKIREKARIKTAGLELIKPMEIPKQKPKLKLKLKPLELIKEKPKIKTSEIPALSLKLRLSQAQAKTVSLSDTLTKTASLTSSLTSLKTVTVSAPALTVPVPQLKVKYPLKIKGKSEGRIRNPLKLKTEKKQTFNVINLANLKINI